MRMSGVSYDDPWLAGIPALHDLLSGRATRLPFPAPSRIQDLTESCTVWETLNYLLKSLLGWDDVGLGLAEWYRRGLSDYGSELLRHINEFWNQEGELDFFAAWAWTRQTSQMGCSLSASQLASESLLPDLEWWRRLLARPRPIWPDPFYGGTNPLHLGHSETFGLTESEPDRSELYLDHENRRGVLIVNELSTWRVDLSRIELRLPSLGQRSWHVRVIDNATGLIGIFRRSRLTGRWFQGKHDFHSWGHC